MGIPSRMKDRAVVLSKLKQANYATLVTDVNLGAGKRFAPNAAVFGQPEPRYYNNREQTMKAHDYTTQIIETERELAEQLSFDGDTWLLAWMLAFGLGKVTTTQPNAGPNPTAYQHVFRPLDPATDGKDLPVTTVYTEVANVAALKRRLHACMVRELAIDFPPSSVVQVSCTLQGSGQITTGALAGIPALSAMTLLKSNDMQFFYGAQAGPTDISSEIVRGSVRFGFSWNPDDDNSRAPGGGLYRSRAWVGMPSPTLEFQRFVDDAASTPHDEWLAGTIREVKIVVEGAQIGPGPEKHKLEIRGLAVIPQGVRIGQSGDKSVYQYTISPEHWIKEGANDVLTVTVLNTESSYLV